MKHFLFLYLSLFVYVHAFSQVKWENADSMFPDLPASVRVYKSTSPIDGKANVAYYVIADLKSKSLSFSTDTTYKRRFTPSQFFEKNGKPLIVVNATFFSFQTNQNLNAVIKDHKLVSYNVHNVPGRGKDTFTYRHPLGSAIGITKNGKADVAWLYTDSTESHAMATQMPTIALKDSLPYLRKKNMKRSGRFKKWKVQTGIGGGPVLVQDGMIKITNNEELKFAGNAVNDRHPRTAMGYTKDNKLVIMVVQGRIPEIAEGVSLKHLAEILRDVGCVEALNLDGGGSSCLLVNGKETIKPSDPNGQRPVPAVFLIKVSR